MVIHRCREGGERGGVDEEEMRGLWSWDDQRGEMMLLLLLQICHRTPAVFTRTEEVRNGIHKQDRGKWQGNIQVVWVRMWIIARQPFFLSSFCRLPHVYDFCGADCRWQQGTNKKNNLERVYMIGTLWIRIKMRKVFDERMWVVGNEQKRFQNDVEPLNPILISALPQTMV